MPARAVSTSPVEYTSRAVRAFAAVVDPVPPFATGSASVALYEVLAGGLVLGAVFMATDYSTTPITARARMLFALGCGLITFVIRWFFTLPEGVSYSILCMNLMVPWLERWTRRKPLGGV